MFVGGLITAKWQNIRDSFVKSLKKKSGQSANKKYLYHDNLLFLLKIVQKDDTQSSIDESQDVNELPEEEAETTGTIQVLYRSHILVLYRSQTRHSVRTSPPCYL
jgi:hypothetical protein